MGCCNIPSITLSLIGATRYGMKIKLDENLPTRLGTLLESLGHLVDTVADEGLTGKPDTDVWQGYLIKKPEPRCLLKQNHPSQPLYA